MKKLLLSAVLGASALVSFGQYPQITIQQLQNVSLTDLQNCDDESSYAGDTVIIVGRAIHDGNLTELASSGAAGYRPGIWIVDTANNSAMAPFAAVQIHGRTPSNDQVDLLDTYAAGDVIRVVGEVGGFSGETQFNPINNQEGLISNGAAIEPISTSGTAPEAIYVDLGQLNDANRENILETGEQWEGAYVELRDLTVTAVNFFSNNERVSFDLTDANGNVINVSDRFLAQKLPAWDVVNSSQPATNGSFTPPILGARLDTIRGIVIHSENGCTGENGRGYELNPFKASDYVYGPTPASITDVTRNPVVVDPSASPVVEAIIQDFDGTVTSATLFYSVDNGANFTSVTMTLNTGSTDEYSATIPSQTVDTDVIYYLEAEDDDNQTATSRYPIIAGDYISYRVTDNGLSIVDVQKVFDASVNDRSPYEGQTVTVSGVVTASLKQNDLTYAYIQQEGETEWAGVNLTGSTDLISLSRNNKVTVTGVVAELGFGSSNVTVIEVSDIVVDSVNGVIEPLFIEPSSDLLAEEHEGMLIGLANANGNPMAIADEDLGFGEYGIGTDSNATSMTRVLAGRRSGFAMSSLYVSLITDSFYVDNDEQILVDTIVITEKGMEIDTLIGIGIHGFGSYKLTPRNNSDIINLSDADGNEIPVDETPVEDAPVTSVNEINVNGTTVNVKMYPNPAKESVQISLDVRANVEISIYDMSGRNIINSTINSSQTTIATNNLQQGIYLVRISDLNGRTLATDRLMIQR